MPWNANIFVYDNEELHTAVLLKHLLTKSLSYIIKHLISFEKKVQSTKNFEKKESANELLYAKATHCSERDQY